MGWGKLGLGRLGFRFGWGVCFRLEIIKGLFGLVNISRTKCAKI